MNYTLQDAAENTWFIDDHPVPFNIGDRILLLDGGMVAVRGRVFVEYPGANNRIVLHVERVTTFVDEPPPTTIPLVPREHR